MNGRTVVRWIIFSGSHQVNNYYKNMFYSFLQIRKELQRTAEVSFANFIYLFFKIKTVTDGNVAAGFRDQPCTNLRIPLCGKANVCFSNPCQNGGSCITSNCFTSYTCTCTGAFTGPLCATIIRMLF